MSEQKHMAVVEQYLLKAEAVLKMVEGINTDTEAPTLQKLRETLEMTHLMIENAAPVIKYLEKGWMDSRSTERVALVRIQELESSVDELQHEVNQDWFCDSCRQWFTDEVENHGVECNLCVDCASAPQE